MKNEATQEAVWHGFQQYRAARSGQYKEDFERAVSTSYLDLHEWKYDDLKDVWNAVKLKYP